MGHLVLFCCLRNWPKWVWDCLYWPWLGSDYYVNTRWTFWNGGWWGSILGKLTFLNFTFKHTGVVGKSLRSNTWNHIWNYMSRNLAQHICEALSLHVSNYLILYPKSLTNHFLSITFIVSPDVYIYMYICFYIDYFSLTIALNILNHLLFV